MTVTDTTQPDALARLLGAGHQVTYAAECTDGWFADLRDASGRCAETGLGATQEQALAHLRERLDRNAASAGVAEPEKPADTAIVAAYADGYQAGIAVATPLEDAGLKAYDRQAHLAMYERTYPDSYCWPPVPRTDAEAEAAIDFYTGDGR